MKVLVDELRVMDDIQDLKAIIERLLTRSTSASSFVGEVYDIEEKVIGLQNSIETVIEADEDGDLARAVGGMDVRASASDYRGQGDSLAEALSRSRRKDRATEKVKEKEGVTDIVEKVCPGYDPSPFSHGDDSGGGDLSAAFDR